MFTVEENGAVKENGAVTITTTCEGEIVHNDIRYMFQFQNLRGH